MTHDESTLPSRSMFGRGYVTVHHSTCPCKAGRALLVTARDYREFYGYAPDEEWKRAWDDVRAMPWYLLLMFAVLAVAIVWTGIHEVTA